MSPGWCFFQVAVSALIELSLTFRCQRLLEGLSHSSRATSGPSCTEKTDTR